MLIGEYIGDSLGTLPGYEVYYSEGSRGELRLYLNESLSNDDLLMLENNILGQGVILTSPIEQDANIVSIKFQKAIAPLLIIAGAVTLIVGSLIGWQIFKTTQMGVPLWVWLVGGLALAYIVFTSEPAKQAGGLAIQAGKVYVTRKSLGNPRRRRWLS